MERYWELDSLRGLSVVLMILFNWSYALKFLKIYNLFPETSFLYWNIFPLIVAGSFMFIAGISLSLSWNRFRDEASRKNKWKKYGLRGLKIFGLGLGITAVTWLTFPDSFIFFGILHLLGLSIALSPLVIGDSRKAFALSVFVVFLFILPELEASSIFLASLGFSSFSFSTFDYFPLVPWSAVVFTGISLGHWLYPDGRRRFEVGRPDSEISDRPLDLLELLGRNSLLIYLLHQPVLVLFLVLLGYPVF